MMIQQSFVLECLETSFNENEAENPDGAAKNPSQNSADFKFLENLLYEFSIVSYLLF